VPFPLLSPKIIMLEVYALAFGEAKIGLAEAMIKFAAWIL
jgi:hypothetical protein